MWIVSALLILAAWTAVGFVAALLFFRLGFGFKMPRSESGLASQVPQPERGRRRAGDRRYVPTPAGHADERRVADGGIVRDPRVRGRLEHTKPVKAAG